MTALAIICGVVVLLAATWITECAIREIRMHAAAKRAERRDEVDAIVDRVNPELFAEIKRSREWMAEREGRL